MENRRCVTVALVMVVLFSSCDAAPPTPLRTLPAPSAAVSQSASPTATFVLPACTQGDVTAVFDGWGAAAGSQAGGFRLAPTRDECVLPARPALRLIDASGASVPFIHGHVPGVEMVLVSAAPGDTTFLLLLWSLHGGEPDYRCARRMAAASLELELPSSRIRFDFDQDRRPLLCVEPPERIFAQVSVRQP